MRSDQTELTVAVLDYRKPSETRACLTSLRANLKVPYTLLYLDNGSGSDYVWDLYRKGLCDTLISKRRGGGGGVGQTDLFRFSDSPYTLFVQSDQTLIRPIYEEEMYLWTGLLNGGFSCVDLNGDQSHRGAWTDRAHLISTDFFNDLGPFPNGGPGEFHHLPWNERHLQDAFAARGCRIAHIRPAVFSDNGVWTVRECAGGLIRMRTDTKAVWWEKAPTDRYVFPEMSPLEWDCAISGQWVGGTIPESYLKGGHSFNCWGTVKEPTYS